MGVELFEHVADLRARVRHWHADGERVVLVPTMGALHDGHISLTRIARLHGDRVVVSIFVNPTQFAPNEDFTAYPRTFEADREKLAASGVDAVFHPVVTEMYPQGFATMVHVEGPAVAGLEDRFRPSHFAGVATIVSKLLLQVGPDAAVFGEKDFQQLAVIRRMASYACWRRRVWVVPGSSIILRSRSDELFCANSGRSDQRNARVLEFPLCPISPIRSR